MECEYTVKNLDDGNILITLFIDDNFEEVVINKNSLNDCEKILVTLGFISTPSISNDLNY